MVFLWFLQYRRVLEKGSQKGVSRRCLERPLGKYDPLGVRPTLGEAVDAQLWQMHSVTHDKESDHQKLSSLRAAEITAVGNAIALIENIWSTSEWGKRSL